MAAWTGSLWAFFVTLFNQAASFRWLGPGTESWEGFSLRAASVWTLAGVILIALGWLTLPRRTDVRTRWFKSAGITAAGRVLVGMATAVVSIALATLAFARVTAKWLYGVTSNLPVPSSLAPGPAPSEASPVSSLVPPWLAEIARTYFLDASRYWTSLHVNGFAVLVALLLGAFVGWMSSSSRWTLSGIATWLGLVLIAAGLFGYSILIVLNSSNPFAWALGVTLLVVEVFGFLLFLSYQFYTIEYIAGSAPRVSRATPPSDPDPCHWPFVAVQVASYNEPTEIVLRCLQSIVALDYPPERRVLQLLDDSTDADAVSVLGAFCAQNGIEYRHRKDRRGFKAGALNDGLKALPPEVELIAIVDSDYIVDPAFLKMTVPPFRSRVVGFVQSPQAYRNAPPGSFARWYALADAYFYRVVQPVRARVQSLIFCGTMGVVARGALEGAGGWSERCVTEDAELSIRLLARGWHGVYIERTLGWGLAPVTMSATRSQHRRWATGGWQMLRMNRKRLAPHHMSQRQRTDFLLSRVFWVDGLFLIGVAAALASVTVASWFGVSLSVRSLSELALVSAAPLLLLFDGVLKLRVALRSTTQVSYRDVLGVLGFWYAIKLNDLWASIGAALGSRLGFVRTPKTRDAAPSRGAAFVGAIRSAPFETSIAAILFGIIGVSLFRWRTLPHVNMTLPGGLLLLWLTYYALAFAAAPGFDYYSRTYVEPTTPGSGRASVSNAVSAPVRRPSTPALTPARGGQDSAETARSGLTN